MGGGGKGGSDSSKSSSEIRFAPYIERHHRDFLEKMQTRVESGLDDSPFSGYETIDIDPAFFGTGYVLSSFPSLYDMYGKFMAGLDIEVLFDQAFEHSTEGAVINNLVSAKASLLSEDIENEAEPRFALGMRDINSVVSSSFVIGRELLESRRIKELNKFDAEIRYKMIAVAADRWKTHLEWNKAVVSSYAEILKLYIAGSMDMNNHNYEVAARDKLWPFTVLEYYRAAVGALSGARSESSEVAGAEVSRTKSALGGAMAGAAGGYMVGGPPGAVVGGILGLAGGLLG